MELAVHPLASLGGGFMIGASAVMLMALNGRIAGITGLVKANLSGARDSEALWFVAGLLLAVPAYALATGTLPVQSVPESPTLMAVAGLLVGAGAAYGSGCTSGHGVCGLSRFSLRSVVAVAVFMITAIVTVAVVGRPV